MSSYLEGIATGLIVAPQPALTGAAAWLAQRAAKELISRPRATEEYTA
jgi:glucokinase